MTTQPSLTPAAFAAKWRGVTTTEKASAQEHFIDLCRMLGEPTPHEADPIGAQFAFEKRVSKAAGGDEPKPKDAPAEAPPKAVPAPTGNASTALPTP